MLVLSRRIGERLVIGDNIEVIVQRVQGNRVTLGIIAPRDVSVLRGELTFDRPTPTVGELSKPTTTKVLGAPLEFTCGPALPVQPR